MFGRGSTLVVVVGGKSMKKLLRILIIITTILLLPLGLFSNIILNLYPLILLFSSIYLIATRDQRIEVSWDLKKVKIVLSIISAIIIVLFNYVFDVENSLPITVFIVLVIGGMIELVQQKKSS